MPRLLNSSKPRTKLWHVALGLTDHNLLTGSIEFVTACRDAGIHPILGLEIDFEKHPLQLLATSFEGWSNLCRLSSAIALSEKPCSFDLLASHAKDLITLSGNPRTLVDTFGDKLYFASCCRPAHLLSQNRTRRFAAHADRHPLEPDGGQSLRPFRIALPQPAGDGTVLCRFPRGAVCYA